MKASKYFFVPLLISILFVSAGVIHAESGSSDETRADIRTESRVTFPDGSEERLRYREETRLRDGVFETKIINREELRKESEERKDSLLRTRAETRFETRANIDGDETRFEERAEIREEHRAELGASSTVEERRAAREEDRAQKAEVQAEQRHEIATRRADHVYKLMTATLERLEGIADRIDSRITKLEEAGRDMSEAATLLAESRTKLEAAGVSIEAIMNVELTAETVREDFVTIRELSTKVKQELKDARRSMMQIIPLISFASPKVETETETETEIETEAEVETE